MSLLDRAAGLFRLFEPEAGHALAIRALRAWHPRAPHGGDDPRLRVERLGLRFPNPIGLAAGFDKGGEATDAMLALGFGFVEVGTVTPLPQPGNPKPRLFRLPADYAVINRLGFNSRGHAALAANLARRRNQTGLVGINIGANKESADRIGDYVAGVLRFGAEAAWLTANISSPNTPGLRDLQAEATLRALLSRLAEARERVAAVSGRRTPLLVKIAPDLDDAQLQAVIQAVRDSGCDGLVIGNTTVERTGLRETGLANESGGVSGRPLFPRSTAMIARARELAGPGLVLVGAGGVESAGTAWTKIAAGADLVQLYTALFYEGPSLPRRIVAGLRARLDAAGLPAIGALRDSETARWAALWPKG
ncbi:quinone-dependent dihydroorotate dehydrogenase [Propylenella binzhouense]|uniref:Dihydroorotate dehydrogenase (quinone) n=1 Tax=Propylenella binzhouense TaxID=2555902 RepID=A0A964T3W5_9HYPH|nr:quinone-dependent dihydroorotate dehydrogenase [Propylenella binzhouense]MYZ47993.1 quinone-dependent dihydroorotate dehydrogenase [Propylenella binzhouense]